MSSGQMTSDEQAVYGSDVIVDLLVNVGIKHVAMNPGATFRGIHDSLVHRPGAPKIVQCLHEAVAVGVAQGYAKAAGEPMGVLLHNVVGLQNASMAIYNAWRDRSPMMLIGGTGPKSQRLRRPWIDWIHTASVQANIVRDFVVWDNEPHDLYSVPESFVRGFNAAVASPGGPVYLCIDTEIQEETVPLDFQSMDHAQYPVAEPPAPSTESIKQIVEALSTSKNPVFLTGFVGESDASFALLAEAAELAGAAVVDSGVRHTISTVHSLCATGVAGIIEDADLIVAFDVDDLAGPLHKSTAPVINITMSATRLRSWAQDFQSLWPGTTIAADADAAISAIVEYLHDNPLPHGVVAERTARIRDRVSLARAEWRGSASTAELEGVVPLERLVYEVGESLKNDRFVLANGTNQRLEQRTWVMDEPRQYLGWHSGGGLGYGVPAAIGASVALGEGTIVVDIQADGDLLFLPSALWTAAHWGTPTLIVVNNNRQYGNTVEHAQKIAIARGRSDESRYVGAGISTPPVDIAELARSQGVWAIGPVADPIELKAALAAALAEVRAGRPALIDVITPGF